VSPAHVLAVYAEPLIAGRRVAVLAPEDPSLLDAILALGARLLYVYDPRPSVEAPKRGIDPRITIAPLRAGDLGVREGAFDLALVPDLGMLGDAEAALAYVRRLVGPTGVALVASRNREAGPAWTRAREGSPAPSYTEFYDLCALQFAEVRMAGVAAFAAYAIAEFAPEREPSIAFDASLVATPEPPEWFVAVAAQSSVAALEAYEIIQIPRDEIAVEAGTDPGELDALRLQIVAADQKRQEAEARAGEESLRAERSANELRSQHDELRKLRDKAQRVGKELEDERRARERIAIELGSARHNPELAQLRERTLALEAELIEARTQLATPRAAAIDPRVQQERDALAAEVVSLRAAVHQAQAANEDQKQRIVDRERELSSRASELVTRDRELATALAVRERELAAAIGRARELQGQLADATRREESAAANASSIEAAQERIAKAETMAVRYRQELEAIASTHEHDVASLEAALRTAGEELRQARIELVRRERMIRELVAQVEEGGLPLPVPTRVVEPPPELLQELELARRELATLVTEIRRRDRLVDETRTALEVARRDVEIERARTESLARDAARREAALQTASWRIAELEKLGADAEPVGDADEQRVAVNAELDALRRALTQAQDRIEQLERELGTAPSDDVRARLQQQEALIAQLSAELSQRHG